MIRLPFLRTILVAILAVAAAMPGNTTTAAIACQELPVIEAPPDMMMPMIYLELPRTVEDLFARGLPADRENAAGPEADKADDVIQAAENQFRCLGYEHDVAFAGNSTPGMRAHMFALPDVDPEADYVSLESLYLEQLGEPVELEDGRFLIDFGVVVDGSQYLIGEMIFLEQDGELYLDFGALHKAIELNEDPITIEIGEAFTREVKIVEVENGDLIVFENQEDEASADITVIDADGETTFEGFAMANTMVGGEDTNVFVVHDFERGEYTVTITFSPSEIEYNITLVVGANNMATPSATPGN